VKPQALSSLPSSWRNALFPQRGQAGSLGVSIGCSVTYWTIWFELDVFALVHTSCVSELNLGPYMLLSPL
jgi:hypothetical protein